MIAADVSKYIGSASPSIPSPAAMKNAGNTMVARLYPYAADVPTAISVFMSVVLWRRALIAPT